MHGNPRPIPHYEPPPSPAATDRAMSDRAVKLATRKPPHMRKMTPRDLAEVAEIDRVFPDHWQPAGIRCLMEGRNVDGFVTESDMIGPTGDYPVIGYTIYQVEKRALEIVRMAVHPGHRRQGVGTAMVDRLKDHLGTTRRNRIYLNVRETNLAAQQFMRVMGLLASLPVLRAFYEDTGEDGFTMEWKKFDECGD